MSSARAPKVPTLALTRCILQESKAFATCSRSPGLSWATTSITVVPSCASGSENRTVVSMGKCFNALGNWTCLAGNSHSPDKRCERRRSTTPSSSNWRVFSCFAAKTTKTIMTRLERSRCTRASTMFMLNRSNPAVTRQSKSSESGLQTRKRAVPEAASRRVSTNGKSAALFSRSSLACHAKDSGTFRRK